MIIQLFIMVKRMTYTRYGWNFTDFLYHIVFEFNKILVIHIDLFMIIKNIELNSHFKAGYLRF